NITWAATDGSTSAPAITQQPQSQVVAPGGNATFSVVAIGYAPLNYQWRFNGNAIPGASGTSCGITNAQFGDAGDYLHVITNDLTSVRSSFATLVVGIAPTIGSQPQSVNTNLGASLIFSVDAAGTPPPNYQWRLNGNPLAGATSNSYTRMNVQPA